MTYIELQKDIYHIGNPKASKGLNCNPYLLVDNNEAVLFDPGSSIDFPIVLSNLKELISLEKIRYVVLHHQDPDLCTAVPLLEKEGLQAQIITSWRGMTLIQFYGIHQPFYLIEEQNMRLKLESGRTLTFIPTPYLHFAGAFVTYDETTRSLFSSDLFGAFSYNPTLFADENYMEKMLSFHEHYMPSNSVLRPVMDMLSMFDINMILPQHGAIIKEHIPDYINALRNLECGSLLTPLKKNLIASGGFIMIFREVYKRISSLYPYDEVKKIFDAIPALELNENNEIIAYHADGHSIWNAIFAEIKTRQGMIWLTTLQPFVENLCAVYDLVLPDAFSNVISEIVLENKRLQEINQNLDQTIKTTNNRLLKCHITGLYNETFFNSLLIEEMENQDQYEMGTLVYIAIDNLPDYRMQFGIQEERTVLKNMAYLLKEEFSNNAVYRLDFIDFALYVKGVQKQVLIEKLDNFRTRVSIGDYFLASLTISVGIAFPDEIELSSSSISSMVEKYQEIATSRLHMATVSGKNRICYQGTEDQDQSVKGKVLLVDTDITNVTLLKTFLEEDDFEVFISDNGIDAQMLAIAHHPNVIVSEVMLNKLDGFGFRSEIIKNSRTKDIETIFLSYKKDDECVERAIALGVTHYIHKPYLISELIGIIKHIVGKGSAR